MKEMTESTDYPQKDRQQVLVPVEDADMIQKVHRILKAGKNVEIKKDARGKPKVLKVSKEIEQ